MALRMNFPIKKWKLEIQSSHKTLWNPQCTWCILLIEYSNVEGYVSDWGKVLNDPFLSAKITYPVHIILERESDASH